jgi:drug/metabolite transporter (DMT)-like permease
MTHSERIGLLYVTLAVAFFSTSPIFVRWAAPLSPYEVTVGRLATGALLVMILARLSGQPLRPSRDDWSRFLGFGLVTALHFLFYIASLSFTTIAHSLTLVYTAPIFVTIASAWFLHEPIPPRKWLGVFVAVIGVGILAGFEPHLTSQMIIGDLLAFGSAVMYGLYSVAGRSQRKYYPLFTYAGAVYGIAALWTLPAAALSFTPGGYGLRQIGSIIALGILSSGLGHTLYNAALRRTHATYVNLIATQEVTGGIILGILFLQEVPSFSSLLGVAMTLLGIALVVISG